MTSRPQRFSLTIFREENLIGVLAVKIRWIAIARLQRGRNGVG